MRTTLVAALFILPACTSAVNTAEDLLTAEAIAGEEDFRSLADGEIPQRNRPRRLSVAADLDLPGLAFRQLVATG